ncbi:MAG: glycine cleavage system aminomethyltransferase GcvT [Actinomycetota bacterium]
MDNAQLRRTPLHDLHIEHGGRLTPFAGWELPTRYDEVTTEHRWCRSSAALFDVSHMAVVTLTPAGSADLDAVIHAVEALTPASIATLAPGKQRYSLLTNADGGVIDDLIVTRLDDHLMIVANAGRRDVDLAHLREHLDPSVVTVTEHDDRALLALQGPKAVDALARIAPDAADLTFLSFAPLTVTAGGTSGVVGCSRSGYTGEDGFELVVSAEAAVDVARALLDQPEVRLAGLGARDTLRLEAGLHLYGQDLDETTSPVEAGLTWTVPKRRREDARFPGAKRILAELADGPTRIRVGLRPDGRRPVRDGSALATPDGQPIGVVTSGGFGPTVDAPIAMGFVDPSVAAADTPLVADVRGRDAAVTVSDLPFVPHRYHRG